MPILYEGRTAKGAVAGGSDLDELFEDMFAEHTRRGAREAQGALRHHGRTCSKPRS